MLMYNLLEYSSNYCDTRDSLWISSKNEATYFNADIEYTNTFKYMAKLLGNAIVDGNKAIKVSK